MTFAEIILFLIVLSGIYFLLKPLQRRLERILYAYFRARKTPKEGKIVDITDYTKDKKDP